ncbi:MAG: hypothetical protein AAF963_01655 [Bacteroidota bacterium]
MKASKKPAQNKKMQQLTLTVEDSRYDTFLALLKTLDYVSLNHPQEQVPLWQQAKVSSRLKRLKNAEMTTRSWSEAKEEVFQR